jgi:Ca-activated chloride channel family protein
VLGRLGVLLALGMAARCEAFTWPDLWSRPDQRAESALQAGHPEQAVPLFADPRRRAYAELQAGKFAAAAADLAPFHDPESQYNRGNALARNGELANAVKAYDAALAQLSRESPLGRNAAHNRALVAQQLPPPQGRNPQSQSSQQGSAASAQSNAGAPNAGAAASRADEGTQSSDTARDPATAQAGDSNSRTDRGNASEREQAQRDVAAGLASGEGRASSSPRSADRTPPRSPNDAGREREAAAAHPADAAGRPATEQAIAREQWLRQIPDDPGGLLRRKFLIEHWLTERQGEP